MVHGGTVHLSGAKLENLTSLVVHDGGTVWLNGLKVNDVILYKHPGAVVKTSGQEMPGIELLEVGPVSA